MISSPVGVRRISACRRETVSSGPTLRSGWLPVYGSARPTRVSGSTSAYGEGSRPTVTNHCASGSGGAATDAAAGGAAAGDASKGEYPDGEYTAESRGCSLTDASRAAEP